MPKIVELVKMLYSHNRNINVNVFKHHIVYSIPTYGEHATAKVVDVKLNAVGDVILTVQRKDPGAVNNSENKIFTEHKGDAKPSPRVADTQAPQITMPDGDSRRYAYYPGEWAKML